MNNQYLHDLLANSEIHPLDAGHVASEQAADEYGRLVADWVSADISTSNHVRHEDLAERTIRLEALRQTAYPSPLVDSLEWRPIRVRMRPWATRRICGRS